MSKKYSKNGTAQFCVEKPAQHMFFVFHSIDKMRALHACQLPKKIDGTQYKMKWRAKRKRLGRLWKTILGTYSLNTFRALMEDSTEIFHDPLQSKLDKTSILTKIYRDFNMSQKISATCLYKSQLRFSCNRKNGSSTKVRGLRYLYCTKTSSQSILYRPQV